MSSERHEGFEELMDRSLAGAATSEEERSLREHLAGCAACGERLGGSQRAIAGLKGFAFEAGPRLNAAVMAAVQARAAQMEARRARVVQWMWMSVAAAVLTVVGSAMDLRVAHVAAAVFDLRPMEVREGLMALWIAPSFGLLLLFPMLPLLTAKRFARGRTI